MNVQLSTSISGNHQSENSRGEGECDYAALAVLQRRRIIVNSVCLGPYLSADALSRGRRSAGRTEVPLLRGLFDDALDALDHRRRCLVDFADQRLDFRAAGEFEVDLPLVGVALEFGVVHGLLE